jgi:integrase/recombinase XerC
VVGSKQHNAPAAQQRPGADTEGSAFDANESLLTPESLALAAQIRRAAMKDKRYRSTPIGEEVGRYMRAMRWSDRSENTLQTYELPLARLSLDFAHCQQLDELTTEDVRAFLDEHWADCSPATRRLKLAVIRSFLAWAVEEGRAKTNVSQPIKSPKRAHVERRAYSMDVIDQLRAAQPHLRDQICVQLLGRLALRKNELRLIRIDDINLADGTVLVHGKGAKDVVMPLGLKTLKRDLEVYLVGLAADEYLLHPKSHRTRPMNPASVHRWLKRCLERAGLPGTIKIHELRHSAADHLWRKSGNIVMAQELLRHESPSTTIDYLHPTRADLETALQSLDE